MAKKSGKQAVKAELRKQRTREHVIADWSCHYVERFVLENNYAAERTRVDYGYDMTVITFDENGYAEAGEIKFQLSIGPTFTVVLFALVVYGVESKKHAKRKPAAWFCRPGFVAYFLLHLDLTMMQRCQARPTPDMPLDTLGCTWPSLGQRWPPLAALSGVGRPAARVWEAYPCNKTENFFSTAKNPSSRQ